MTGARPAVFALGLAGSWYFTAAPQTLVTVAQSEALRSPRAARTSDVSADGRSIAFESRARLVPADTDDQPDIYVLDRVSGRVTLESGAIGDGEHSHPRISGDGRLVVFETRPPYALATPRADIALHDRVDGTTRLLTKTVRNDNPYGWSRNPDISDDGRVVAFSSAATTLTDGLDVNGTLEDVYLMRLPGGSISRVSLSAGGAQLARGDSILPSLSADGRWVAFASTAALDDPAAAAAPAGRRPRQVFLRDAIEGRTTRVAPAARRGVPNADSSLPSISGDGRFVTFVSDASNLLDDDRNQASDIFLYDREADAVTWVSRAADGSPAAGESLAPVISASGRFVAFQSDAGNLVCSRRCAEQADDINLIWDAFVFDRTTRQIVRISEDELGGWMEPSAGPSLDAMGTIAAFSSKHPVDASDRAGDFDLFVRALTVAPIITRRPPE